MFSECMTHYLAISEDETQFMNGSGCWLYPVQVCPGPVIALENLNYDNTYIAHHWEGTCTFKAYPEPVQPSDETTLLPLIVVSGCIALLVLLACIIPSCLCCCGVCGKKTCWYDCCRSKKNESPAQEASPTLPKKRSYAEPEIYQALTEMTAQSGLPSSKVKAYVEVLEKYDIFNKHALFLLK